MNCFAVTRLALKFSDPIGYALDFKDSHPEVLIDNDRFPVGYNTVVYS